MFSVSSHCLFGQHGSCGTAQHPGELCGKPYYKTFPTRCRPRVYIWAQKVGNLQNMKVNPTRSTSRWDTLYYVSQFVTNHQLKSSQLNLPSLVLRFEVDTLPHELPLRQWTAPGHAVVVYESLLLAVVVLVSVAVVGLVAVRGGPLLGRLPQVVLDHLSLHVSETPSKRKCFKRCIVWKDWI